MSYEISSNLPELSVSEISNLIKKTIDVNFSYIKIKGEVSGFKKVGSGHSYFSLKDTDAVLDSVIWRGKKIDIEIEDGMEIICYGSITTFQKNSKYQLIVDKVEMAGIGLLMAKLEELKNKLTKEGLFSDSYKKPIPKFPKNIAVITSPTGAVIRDIMHRISERFPVQVYLFPVLVQGDKCASQICDAVQQVNNFSKAKIDVIIIARGGGSFEDLWPFNDETLVRTVFASKIPVISAVGHETDVTLLDYVADLRAPTPTAAAEKATPNRVDIKNYLDSVEKRLGNLCNFYMGRFKNLLLELVIKIPHPNIYLGEMDRLFNELWAKKIVLLENHINKRVFFLENLSLKITKETLEYNINSRLDKLNNLVDILESVVKQNLSLHALKLANLSSMLESFSYQNVLKRGFAVVRDDVGNLIKSVKDLNIEKEYSLELSDGVINFQIVRK